MSKQERSQDMEGKADAMSVGSNALSIMELNGLKYRIPQPLSTGVMRTYKREYAQKQSYNTNAPVIFDWNTGTSYVEPQSALLSFKLVLLQTSGGAVTYSFGDGLGGCSLFKEIRIISKNGVECDRTSDAHILAKVLSDYTMSTEARANMGMCDGYDRAVGIVTASGVPKVVQITIPMKLLSGFFRPTVEGMLLPAGLASGLRIEMTLAPATRAFVSAGDANVIPAYSVDDAQLLMQLTDLNDPVQAALMKESASNGLEYTFPSYFTTEANLSGTQITEQIKKAVSQSTRIFVAIYDKTTDDVDLITNDGFQQINPNRFESYQFRVGSSYFPSQIVTATTEFWAVANSAFDQLRKFEYRPNQVNFTTFYSGKALLATSLETNDRLNLSGLPINNSSVAEFRYAQKAGTFQSGAGAAATAQVQAVIFLEFISVCKIALNRTTLRI
jgi:hypothetical protein